jgi:hypothetical protein
MSADQRRFVEFVNGGRLYAVSYAVKVRGTFGCESLERSEEMNSAFVEPTRDTNPKRERGSLQPTWVRTSMPHESATVSAHFPKSAFKA